MATEFVEQLKPFTPCPRPWIESSRRRHRRWRWPPTWVPQASTNERSNDLAKSLQDGLDFFRGNDTESSTDALYGKRSDLADLDPGSFRQFGCSKFERQRELGPGLLTRKSYGNNSAGSFIENIMTEDHDGPFSGLLLPANWIQVSPTNLASQYSGHVSPVAARPSSASRCSSVRSSFAHSSASRVRPSRWSFSRSAASTA
jgi:hypothetical protein